jgi:hypothetical protein
LALHGVRLRGRVEPDAVAEYMGADPDAMRTALTELEAEGLVEHRSGRRGWRWSRRSDRSGRFAGFSATPAGRTEDVRLLAEELDAHGLRPHYEAAYEEFLLYNRQLLTICTMWQLREDGGTTVTNDHTDPDHDRAVLEALDALDHHVRPVLAALCDGLHRF